MKLELLIRVFNEINYTIFLSHFVITPVRMTRFLKIEKREKGGFENSQIGTFERETAAEYIFENL